MSGPFYGKQYLRGCSHLENRVDLISADGTCIIDVELPTPDSRETDRASHYDIKSAAFNIIKACLRPHGWGGKSVGVGESCQMQNLTSKLHSCKRELRRTIYAKRAIRSCWPPDSNSPDFRSSCDLQRFAYRTTG